MAIPLLLLMRRLGSHRCFGDGCYPNSKRCAAKPNGSAQLGLEIDHERRCAGEDVMASDSVSIHLDTSQALTDLSELAALANSSLEVRDGLIGLLEALPQSACLDLDSATAAGANEIRIRLELADPLREFLAAVRAGNRDGLVVEKSHESPSCEGVESGSPMLTREGPGPDAADANPERRADAGREG